MGDNAGLKLVVNDAEVYQMVNDKKISQPWLLETWYQWHRGGKPEKASPDLSVYQARELWACTVKEQLRELRKSGKLHIDILTSDGDPHRFEVSAREFHNMLVIENGNVKTDGITEADARQFLLKLLLRNPKKLAQT